MRPYIVSLKQIPLIPHLILVPGTLIAQWLDELRILFTPNSVDIFIYPGTEEERDMFWAPKGPYHSSRHFPSNRIILAPHTVTIPLSLMLEFDLRVPLQVLRTEYTKLYSKDKEYGTAPWTSHNFFPSIEKSDIAKTLYGQYYLSVTLDEAHNFRNHGVKHSAALELLDNAVIRLVLSATPLQTATKVSRPLYPSFRV